MKGVILDAFFLGVQWLFNAFRHICGDICMWKFVLFETPPTIQRAYRIYQFGYMIPDWPAEIRESK